MSQTTHTPIIELRQVVKRYHGQEPALRGVDLTVHAGEFVALLGTSGAGKTTLINSIAGIDQATAGEIVVANTALHTLGEGARAAWRARTVGVVFQAFQLLPSLSVLHNVMLPMDFARCYARRARKQRALDLLEALGIAAHAAKLPGALSGGQQQRVAIARALANDPAVILADEPTGSLDSTTALEVMRVFEALVAQGRTLLLVTHDGELASRARRVLRLVDGRLGETGGRQ